MSPFRLISQRSQVCFVMILFAGFGLSVLQNITVDDAVTTGAVVPLYIPQGQWNFGPQCQVCLVRPDPSLAYDGTWHDTTFDPGDGLPLESIEFNFTGNALYIYFIIANNITGATTLTNVNFVLDSTDVTSYLHTPDTTTAFDYNVPVYANPTMNYGQHNMVIQPVNLGQIVLILFDYLIYTTESDVPNTSTVPATSTSSPQASTTQTSTAQGTSTSSRPNIDAIVGGTVGGATAALVILLAFLLCRQRRKKSVSSQEEATTYDPFVASLEVARPSLGGTMSSANLTGSMPASVAQPAFINELRANSSSQMLDTSTSAPIIAPSSSGGSNSNAALLEQVALLRDEVARLRDKNHVPVTRSEAPPGYS